MGPARLPFALLRFERLEGRADPGIRRSPGKPRFAARHGVLQRRDQTGVVGESGAEHVVQLGPRRGKIREAEDERGPPEAVTDVLANDPKRVLGAIQRQVPERLDGKPRAELQLMDVVLLLQMPLERREIEPVDERQLTVVRASTLELRVPPRIDGDAFKEERLDFPRRRGTSPKKAGATPSLELPERCLARGPEPFVRLLHGHTQSIRRSAWCPSPVFGKRLLLEVNPPELAPPRGVQHEPAHVGSRRRQLIGMHDRDERRVLAQLLLRVEVELGALGVVELALGRETQLVEPVVHVARDVGLVTVVFAGEDVEEVVGVARVARPAHEASLELALARLRNVLLPVHGRQSRLDPDLAEVVLQDERRLLGLGKVRPRVRHVEEVDRQGCLDSGVFEESLGLVDMRHRLGRALVPGENERREQVLGRRPHALEVGRHDPGPVDRERDGSPHARVGPGLLLAVEREVAHVHAGLAHEEKLALARLDVLGGRGRQAVHDLELAGLQLLEARGVLLDRDEDHAVEVRPTPEVLFVGLEDDLLLALPRLERERSGTHGVLGVGLVPELADRRRADDPHRVHREVAEEEERRHGAVEVHDDGQLVHGGRLDDRGEELGVDELGVVELVTLLQAIEAEGDRGRVARSPVVELDALGEMKGPLLPVRRVLPLLGERGLDRGRVVRIADEPVEDVVDDGNALAVLGLGRVEGDRVAAASEDDEAAVALGVGVVVLGRRRPREGEREDRDGGQCDQRQRDPAREAVGEHGSTLPRGADSNRQGRSRRNPRASAAATSSGRDRSPGRSRGSWLA